MTSDVETPVGVKDKVSVGRPARSRMSRLGRPALILAACAVLAGGGYYAWQTWFAQDGSAASLVTAVVTRGNLEDTVTATGTLQPKDYVDVGTQVSGQLKKLLVDIGAIVKAKDLLAEDQLAQIRLARLQASVGLFKALGGGWIMPEI
jgi:multidrug efflux pump subunit AcrA (membrane-fusion protein)